jgi:HSP20 family protein
VDILETENELVLRADLPGVDMNNVEIQVENSTLTLKGERRFEKTDKQGYHRIERNFGAFARYFSLPDTVDSEKVRADYRSGVLTITLPKKEVAKPRSVRIEVGNN